MRPFDAYGALAYPSTRPDIDGAHIALQGWSNGGRATLASMSAATSMKIGLKPSQGFVEALAFYPACGLHGDFQTVTAATRRCASFGAMPTKKSPPAIAVEF